MYNYSYGEKIRTNKFLERILFHSGRTDENFGHRDIFNMSNLGSYHYHHGEKPHLHPHTKVSLIDLLENKNATIFTTTHGSNSSYTWEAEIKIEGAKKFG